MTTKLLVAGDAKGSLDQLFARVGTVHASKGPFDCLLCVGDFFGDADAAALLAGYRSGTSKVPLRTYVLGPPPADAAPPDADGKVELCPDIFCLTGAGIVTLHGLRVAFASGAELATVAEQVAELRARASEAGFAGCDILLTHDWPRGFHRQLPPDGVPADLLPDRNLPDVGSEGVAEMAAAVRPRYHFCGTNDQPFARAPYRQSLPGGGQPSVCRLVCLANVSADNKKKKWLHALGLAPLATMGAEQLAAAPEGVTETPYPHAAPAPPAPPPPPPGSAADDGSAVGGKRKRPEYAKESRQWVSQNCWFCMASPQFESHFVSAIGEEVYVCGAKVRPRLARASDASGTRGGRRTRTHARAAPIMHGWSSRVRHIPSLAGATASDACADPTDRS